MKKLTNKWLLVYLFIPFLVINSLIIGEQQFVYLAYSFINGSFSLIHLPPTIADLSLYQEKFFWPLGPFPAVLLIPFVWIFKTMFLQGFIQFPLNILNFFLVYKISKKLKLRTGKAVSLAIFFIFGSVYTPIAAIPFSWYFAQVIATSLLLFAIYEFLAKKNYLIIGIALALATLTRTTLIVSSIFFIIYLLKKPISSGRIAKFTIPLVISLVILGSYNYLRFGNIFEAGYKYQIIPEESAQRRKQGLFSLRHIPANLYYMLIKTPDPILSGPSHTLKFPYLKFDNYGMSIFFMSPVLFLLFKAKLNDKLVKTSLFTVLLTLVPILTYYGIGYKQVGYRYALDFFPFLLIPLISAVKKTSQSAIIFLIIIGVLLTWFFTIEMLLGV